MTMRNLILPFINPHEILNDIINAKQFVRSTRLRSMAPIVHNRFHEYEEFKFSLENISEQPWEDVAKDDLHHCYNNITRPLDSLKHEIKQTQLPIYRRICQYCGLNTVESIFDHYLPKERFPEYAVYGFNLVPCCFTCNTKKSDVFLRYGERQFVNLYYDTLPQEKYLCVRILAYNNESIPVAEYYLDSSVSQLIRNHFTNLDLLARFSEAAPEVFSEIKTSITSFGSSLTDTQSWIANQLDLWRAIHLNNHWKVVLYEQLLMEPDVLQQLCTSIKVHV